MTQALKIDELTSNEGVAVSLRHEREWRRNHTTKHTDQTVEYIATWRRNIAAGEWSHLKIQKQQFIWTQATCWHHHM